MQQELLVKFSYNPHCKIVSLELYWSKQTTSAVPASGYYNTLNTKYYKEVLGWCYYFIV